MAAIQTQCLPATPPCIECAAALLGKGQVVGIPTETVYGLAANALDDEAVRRIFAAKSRPADNPLIVHVSRMDMIPALIDGDMPDVAQKLADVFWPGPLTMIMRKSAAVAPSVSPGLKTVSIRMPAHPVATALIECCGLPLAAPSANRSGRPSPTTAAHVMEDMDGIIPLIVDGGASAVGLESTVLDVTCQPPRILRPGGVTPEMIAAVVGEVVVDPLVLSPLGEDQQPTSPGMKYRHYAPRGALTIIEGEPMNVAAEIRARYDAAVQDQRCILALDEHIPWYGERKVHSLGSTPDEAAHNLFDQLRMMDALGMQIMLCEGFEAEGIGLALMNRLTRAAGFHIIKAQEDITT